jgi:hypothetical protein
MMQPREIPLKSSVIFTTCLVVLLLGADWVSAQGRGSSNRRRGDRMPATALREGDPAIDFSLGSADGKRKVTLSAFRGKRPVILVFGSYT